MELRQLRYFLAIAEEKQITAAARRLHIAQPPLSYQLRQLEEELGVPLVRRGPRFLTLTGAGELLRQKAEQILSLTESAESEISNVGRGLSGTLTIGTISSSGGIIPDRRTLDFARQFPGIRFEIHEGNTYTVLEMLQKGIVELGIVRTPFQQEMFHYRYTPAEPMVAVMTRENLCGRAAGHIGLEELANVPLIIYRRFETLVGEAFAKADAAPRFLCKNDDARTTIQWACAGLGVGLVPRSAFRISGTDNLTAKEIDCPDLVTRMAVIWMKNRYLSPPGKKFIELFIPRKTD